MVRLARLLALGIALLPGLASAEQASFSFSVAGIKVGQMTMVSEQEGGRYTATSRIDTAGLAGMFDFFFDGSASGIVEGGRVVPSKYVATSKSTRALRKTDIGWRGGVPVSVSVVPPRESAPEPAKQGGTLDPVSAGFRLFRTAGADAICDARVDVFDGSRRSRLSIAKPKPGADGLLVCDGTFARIEGEAHSMADLREFPFALVFGPAGDGLYQLERIEAPTNFGNAVLTRRG